MLAAFLPQIIDMLTPDGNVPSGGLDQAPARCPVSAGCSAGCSAVVPAAPDRRSAGLDDLLGGLGGMLGPKGG